MKALSGQVGYLGMVRLGKLHTKKHAIVATYFFHRSPNLTVANVTKFVSPPPLSHDFLY